MSPTSTIKQRTKFTPPSANMSVIPLNDCLLPTTGKSSHIQAPKTEYYTQNKLAST